MEKHIPFRLMTLFLILSIIFGLVSECRSQTIITNNDGKKVALQPDGTWEYVDEYKNLDSLKRRILNIESNQKHIQFNLDKCHKQFRTGLLLGIAGTALTLFGAHIDSQRLTDKTIDNNKPTGLVTIGSIITSVGAIVIIDSHKFIGRAGRRKKS
jgi:hypothetical protein